MFSYMIIGGQWGSEGKGLFAGYMAGIRKPDAVVSQFGPNAGHTWWEGDQPIVFKCLPVASIAGSVDRIFLGPGSVINPDILGREILNLEALLHDKDIYVHEAAAILLPGDAALEEGENGVSHIASTRQGTSEAMIRKIRRPGEYPARLALSHLPVTVLSHDEYIEKILRIHILQIEGAQGMDLSINSGWRYPYVTSRDCTPSQVLADCGLHPRDLGQVYACIRTYPIRVGNIIGGNGVVVGNSGPCYPDQKELTWEQIGVEQELTTVTKRVRRVFSFSYMQINRLLRDVRPSGIFLNFGNYIKENDMADMEKKINGLAGGSQMVKWTGWGPRGRDIYYNTPPNMVPTQYQE